MEHEWRNWAGTARCRPAAVHHPRTEDELADVVRRAGEEDRRVRVVGAGHSFTDIATTDGHLVVLDHFDRVLELDTNTYRVTVEAGITLERLNLELDRRGLALPNLGDIAYQTVAGATQTGTHGTGARLRGLADAIVALRLVQADGRVLACDAEREPEVFRSARVGLGALGVLSHVTLQCVPAFHLHAVEEPRRVDAVLEGLDDWVDGNDHAEFFWVPHTGWALTKTNNRTREPLAPRGRYEYWRDKVLFENRLFGLACRVGRRRPAWIPRLTRMVPSSGRQEFVEPSYRVFASPRTVRFVEMEYAVPRAACAAALTEIRRLVEREDLLLSFPVEVRFTAGDDIPLSTAAGRDSAYLAVHVYQGMPYERYFRGVEAIMDAHEGRPHWGKLHFQDATTLAPRYPGWEAFQAVRRRLDPDGRFANPYLRRVLG